MARLQLIITLILSLSSSAWAIRGGQAVQSSDVVYKSTVGLKPKGPSGESVCSATLISDTMAITATHCYALFGNSEYVYFGSDIDEAEQRRKVKSFKTHENYIHYGLENDMAIIYFEGGLPEGFTPVELATEQEIAQTNKFISAGYGIDERGQSGILKKTQLKRLNRPFFRKHPHRNSTSVALRASSEGGACPGDSGGPMYISTDEGLKLAAVFSFDDPGRCLKYAVGTKVSSYAKWIQKTMEELEEASK